MFIRDYVIERSSPIFTRHTIPEPDSWTEWRPVPMIQPMEEDEARRLLQLFRSWGSYHKYRVVKLHREEMPW